MEGTVRGVCYTLSILLGLSVLNGGAALMGAMLRPNRAADLSQEQRKLLGLKPVSVSVTAGAPARSGAEPPNRAAHSSPSLTPPLVRSRGSSPGVPGFDASFGARGCRCCTVRAVP